MSIAVGLVAVVTLGQPLPNAPPSQFLNIVENVAQNASVQLVGAGITLPNELTSAPWKDGANEIVWKQIRNDVDRRGGSHTFYRQYLRSGGADAELFGSEIAVHSTKAGAVWSVSGRQFTAVRPNNRVAFAADDAVNRVLVRLQHLPGFSAETAADARAHLSWRSEHSILKIVYTPTGYRYAWFTFGGDAHGAEYQVIMDAESEAILAIHELTLSSNCQPTTPWQMVSATGIPVRSADLPGVQRSLRANIAADRPYPYYYEAYDSTGTHTTIVQETGAQAYKCNQAANRAYTLEPLQIESGRVVYRDRTEPSDGSTWHGSAAADALFNTQQTLSAFSTLGRYGWDGRNGDANVVIDSTFDSNNNDYGFFRMTGSGDPRVPPTPFFGIAPSRDFYNMAAALDAVAHEWTHGVIFTSANFPCVDAFSVGCQMHEGFADVVAQMVEKMKQPPGNGLEQSSDWTMHEDNGRGGYVRGAIDDGAGHSWTNINGVAVNGYNQAVHRQDIDGAWLRDPNLQEAHVRGSMLTMVLRLMTEGGTNPICSRHPEYDGCATAVRAQGLTKSGQILFDAIQYYIPSSAQWVDLATYASQAAFDDYSQCDYLPYYHATGEQATVNQAFTAIGYPRGTAAYRCP